MKKSKIDRYVMLDDLINYCYGHRCGYDCKIDKICCKNNIQFKTYTDEMLKEVYKILFK
jgi:hypothetical protein